MDTLRLAIDPAQLESSAARGALALAAALVRAGELVALPTETVYGLGANALDPAAVVRIFKAKQRPAWDPVIVHIAGPASVDNPMLRQLVTAAPESARRLIEAFWPGPLTLLLPRSAAVPDVVTAGRPLVGIRMPAHPVALRLIENAGIPIAAPSANVFAHISPTSADHVLADLSGRIAAVLDAGPTRHGVESTVLDPMQSPMIVYRPGAVTLEQIRLAAGPVELFHTDQPLAETPPEALPSPGVGLRHYAPRARLVLVNAPVAKLAEEIVKSAASFTSERLGLLLPTELQTDARLATLGSTVFAWGHWSNPDELAQRLYAGLRALDDAGCTTVICPLPPAEGVGVAVSDRLRKAAWKLISV